QRRARWALAIRLEPGGRLVRRLRHRLQPVADCGRPRGPVDLDRYAFRVGSRFDQVKRYVRAVGREQPRALAGASLCEGPGPSVGLSALAPAGAVCDHEPVPSRRVEWAVAGALAGWAAARLAGADRYRFAEAWAAPLLSFTPQVTAGAWVSALL